MKDCFETCPHEEDLNFSLFELACNGLRVRLDMGSEAVPGVKASEADLYVCGSTKCPDSKLPTISLEDRENSPLCRQKLLDLFRRGKLPAQPVDVVHGLGNWSEF